MENWKKFVNESEMRIYGTQKDWTPPEDDPDAKDPGAWRAFRDNEYLEAESSSGLFFIHSEQKRLRSGELKFNPKGKRVRDSGRSFITHKPSGKQIPVKMILMHPDFQGKNSLSLPELKKYMEKLDAWAVQNIPDISSETLSPQSEAKLAEFIAGDVARDFYQNKNSNLSSIMENWRSFTNEIVGKEDADAMKDFSNNAKTASDDMAAQATAQADASDAAKKASDAATKSSESFKEFANSISAFSDSVSDDAEQSDEMLELFTQLKDAGLEDFIKKIGDLEPLGDFVEKIADDGQASGELIAQLVAADIKPEEFVEGITKMQEEFAKFKEDTEKRAEEDAAAEEEQERRLKDMERAAAEQEVAAQGAAEG